MREFILFLTTAATFTLASDGIVVNGVQLTRKDFTLGAMFFLVVAGTLVVTEIGSFFKKNKFDVEGKANEWAGKKPVIRSLPKKVAV